MQFVRILFLFFGLLGFTQCFAARTIQSDTVKYEELYRKCAKLSNAGNESAIAVCDSLINLTVNDSGNSVWKYRGLAFFYKGLYQFHHQDNSLNAEKNLLRALQIGDSIEHPKLVVLSSSMLSYLYRNLKDEKGRYKMLIKASEWVDKTNRYDLKSQNYQHFALFYSDNGRMDKSYEYYKEALKLSEEHNDSCNLALIYQNMAVDKENENKSDSTSLRYYEKALLHANTSTCQYYVMIFSNLVAQYLKVGMMEEAKSAIPRLQGYYNLPTQSKQVKYEMLYRIGSIYARMGSVDSARFYYNKCLKLATSQKSMRFTEIRLLEHYSELEEKQGEYEEANRLLSRAYELRKEQDEQDTKQEINEMQVRYEAAKKDLEILKVTSDLEIIEREKSITALKFKRSVYLGVFASILLLGALFFLFYKRRKEKEASQQEILLSRSELEKEKTRSELKEQRLISLKDEINRKNNIVENLKNELDKMGTANDERMAELSSMKILTDEDWMRFKRLFLDIYPGFMDVQLFRQFKFSTSEIRLLMLAKLDIDNKIMASCLGVSEGAVRTTKYRILKRIREKGIQVEFEQLVAEYLST